jgi:Ni,Fe-hydrogenase III large subunit
MTVVEPRVLPGQVTTVRVPAADLEAVVRGLTHLRLADMFATDGDPPVLRLVWADDPGRANGGITSGGTGDHPGYVIAETPIADTEYPALSGIAPAAFVEECEIYEQFGIRPAAPGPGEPARPLNRMMLPPHDANEDGVDVPTLGHKPREEPRDVRAPHTVGGSAFEFPFGPVRQAGAESLYYGLVTSGEEVVDLYLFTWHKHRGIEWRLAGRTPEEGLFFAERAEGLSAVAQGLAFARAAENATGTTTPPAAENTRNVALELERLYNHAAAMAALCQSTGLSVGQSAAEIALERFLRLNAEAFGHRYLFGVVTPGGARSAPDADAIRKHLPDTHGDFRHAADALLTTNSFVDRLEATGILSPGQATTLGLVGPVAIAARDGRGDALARFTVMLEQAAGSVRRIGELLDAGTAAESAALPKTGGTGLGWAESPRGEALAWLALDDGGRITRARLRPASARNWRGFDDACRSQNVFTDVPIIEASFWLTAAGMARLCSRFLLLSRRNPRT